MRILAFDLGDRWTGVATSDPLQILAKPLTTIATKDLFVFVEKQLTTEQYKTIVLGYPKTLKGGESDQTRKIKIMGDALKEKFPAIEWVWWDERFTSKQAASIMQSKNQKNKQASHAMAAAILLMGYLEYLKFNSLS